ncbi:MAG TPA: LTA synthase family protein [Bacilli bacterium]
MNTVFRLLRSSWSRSWFLLLAALLIWAKTFVVQRFVFSLPIDSMFQEWINFISPLSSVLLFLWLALLFSRKRKNLAIIMVSLLTSFVLYANILFYRFYNDFLTLPVLFQTSNASTLGNSLFALMKPLDVFLFLDVVVLSAIVAFAKIPRVNIGRSGMTALLVISVSLFFVNLSMAEIVRPELLSRTFDRGIMVKSIGTYNYHIYDFIQNSKTRSQRAFAKGSNLLDVEQYVKQREPGSPVLNPQQKKDDLFGIAKGKNVVLISLESTQNFVINQTEQGYEITPFLNSLIKDSFYFDHTYHQTGQGKTSDAEFIMDNSLFGLPSGAVYFTHATNTYNSTPKILKEYGYYSAAFHANDKTFWNRSNMYPNLGYDKFFSKEYYTVTEENSIGWGLKDIDFFNQAVDLLKKEVPQPFYAKFITLTNHYTFELDEQDRMIPQYNSGDKTVDRYFTTVRYEDEALKTFFEKMKQEGLYDNTIFILYGDHYGISSNHNKAMSKYLQRPITPYEYIDLQRVPLIIHIPGVKGKTISTPVGQIDLRPTLLYLLGITGENELDFGQNLFDLPPDHLVVLRDGSFVTKDYVYTSNTCYKRGDWGQEIDPQACEPYLQKAEDELANSDKIIYGDLMRFQDDLAKMQQEKANFTPVPASSPNGGKTYEIEGDDMDRWLTPRPSATPPAAQGGGAAPAGN